MRRIRIFASLFVSIILVGCGSNGEFDDTFTFTEQDAADISNLLDRIEDEQFVDQNGDDGSDDLVPVTEVILDVSHAHKYASLRTSLGSVEGNVFRVTNVFLNVREHPNVQSKSVEQLKEGDQVSLLDFPNARWAHVQLADGRTGYVSTAYIAQITTDEDLSRVQEQYAGLYEVNFQFLNVRAEPNSQAQKLGELLSHQLVRPLAIEEQWARIPFGDGEGFVSSDYLRPFMPPLMVRQENFTLSIIHYRGDDPEIADALVKHLAFLKSAGKEIITMSDFYNLLKQQEERDVRLSSDKVLLVISDVTGETGGDVSDALRASGVGATFFLKTAGIGKDGVSTQFIKTLIANGNDVQSAGHTGDDLRSFTNSQVALDLAQSRQILEDLTGKNIFAVLYPSGGVNDRIAEQAIEMGYLFGVTLTPSVGGESFGRAQFLKLPSNLVTATTSEGTLGSLVN